MREARSLKKLDHRPWPVPSEPWVMAQRWLDLLFAHWPIPAEALRPLIPEELELDTYDGQAWLGVVPFRMEGVRPRFSPSVPGLSDFPELNVRTYVRQGHKAGVWFFSLDAGNKAAVRVARKWFHLPYFDAQMSLHYHDSTYFYRSQRVHKGSFPAAFKGWYRPLGRAYQAKPGSLEHWLTERYCLYARSPKGKIFCGEIHHMPWPLQKAEASLSLNTMALPMGLELPNAEPLLHFARNLDVVVWAPERLN